MRAEDGISGRSTLKTQVEANDEGADELPAIFGCECLASFLCVDRKTIQGLAQRREIPCRKVGKAYRFYRPAVLSWLVAGEQRPARRR